MPVLKKWIFLIATLVVMLVIFALSAQPGTQSYALSAQLAETIQQDNLAQAAPGWFSADFHANLRKWAHVWLYCLLGVSTALTVCAFRFGKIAGRGRAFWLCTAFSLGVCLLYAAGDELHQYFVPGRACLPTDILVDALGFAPGTLLACLLWYGKARRGGKSQPKN